MAACSASFALAHILATTCLQGGTGFSAPDLLSIHQLESWTYSPAWSHHPKNELATANHRTVVLGSHCSCAGTSAVHRATHTKDSTWPRPNACTRHLAVDGNPRLSHTRRQAHAARRCCKAGRQRIHT